MTITEDPTMGIAFMVFLVSLIIVAVISYGQETRPTEQKLAGTVFIIFLFIICIVSCAISGILYSDFSYKQELSRTEDTTICIDRLLFDMNKNYLVSGEHLIRYDDREYFKIMTPGKCYNVRLVWDDDDHKTGWIKELEGLQGE